MSYTLHTSVCIYSILSSFVWHWPLKLRKVPIQRNTIYCTNRLLSVFSDFFFKLYESLKCLFRVRLCCLAIARQKFSHQNGIKWKKIRYIGEIACIHEREEKKENEKEYHPSAIKFFYETKITKNWLNSN